MVFHHFDLRQARRREAEAGCQLFMNRFEIAGHIFAKQFIAAGERHDFVVVGLGRRVFGEVFQDLDHVIGADVEGVGFKGRVEQVARLGLATNLHIKHSQADARARGLGIGLDRQQELARSAE